MAKITEFNKQTCAQLGDAMGEALKAVEDAYGVKIKAHGGSYTEGEFIAKFEVVMVGEGGITSKEEAERADFKEFAKSYGLKPTDLDKVISVDWKQYQIVGMSMSSAKYPVLLKNLSPGPKQGKRTQATVDFVKLGLKQ
jgi:hypothetical protein